MIQTISRFRPRKVQEMGSSMYLAIPCEVHKDWKLSQGIKLEIDMLESGDLMIRKPEVIQDEN